VDPVLYLLCWPLSANIFRCETSFGLSNCVSLLLSFRLVWLVFAVLLLPRSEPLRLGLSARSAREPDPDCFFLLVGLTNYLAADYEIRGSASGSI